jgi:hypothetical protein
MDKVLQVLQVLKLFERKVDEMQASVEVCAPVVLPVTTFRTSRLASL